MAAAAEAPEQQRAYYYPAQAPMPSVTLPGALPREELYRQFDFNQDGRVSRAEFVHGMKSLQAGGPVGTLVYGPGYTGDALPPAAAEAMARHGLSADAVAAAQHAASTGGARMGGAGSSSSQHAMGSGWGAGGAAAWDAAGGNQRPIWAQNGAGGSGFGGCPAGGIGAGQTGGPGGGLGGYLGGGPGGFVGGPCGGPGGFGGGPCGSPGGFGGGPCSGPGGFGGGGPGGAPGAGIGGGYPGTPGAGSSGDGLTSDTVERLAPIRVPLRKPKYPGGKVFYGDVPSDSATFAYSELCATPDPEAALAPTPQIPVKKWYNTYLYVPEERRAIKDGGQFMERFVQGPDGEWLDVPKARRMAQHIEDTHRRNMEELAEKKAIQSGAAWTMTGGDHHGGGLGGAFGGGDNGHGGGGLGGSGGAFGGAGAGAGGAGGLGADGGGAANFRSAYTDPYSGERLVLYRGQLLPKEELFAQHNIHESEFKRLFEDFGQFDFDNFRVPWPFGVAHRNKKVSTHAYEWFDRQNPYIPTDKSYEMLELPSIYVDKENYDRWRAFGGETPAQFVHDVAVRATHFDDYPYRI